MQPIQARLFYLSNTTVSTHPINWRAYNKPNRNCPMHSKTTRGNYFTLTAEGDYVPQLTLSYSPEDRVTLTNKHPLSTTRSHTDYDHNSEQDTLSTFKTAFALIDFNKEILRLLYPENLGATFGAGTACGRPLVLKSNFLGIFNVHLGPALNTICLCHSVFLPSILYGR